MFKKNKRHSTAPAEGIVVGSGGGSKSVKTPKPEKPAANQMIQGSDIASSSPKTIKKKHTKVVLGATIFVLLVGIVVGAIVSYHPNKVVTDQPLPQTYVKRQQADLVAVQGTITTLNTQTIVIQKTDGSQQAHITSDTTYKKGKLYLQGVSSDLKTGMPVKLTYDKNTNEAFTIWYGY
jgi:hypothetical protein